MPSSSGRLVGDSAVEYTAVKSKQYRFTAVATMILVVAAVFRLTLLQDIPPGLARDESLNADIATFILQGKHALFFREGFGHEPLYHYLAAGFQFLLGDNYLAIRLPSVYLGILLVASTMRWSRREFNPVTSLGAGALLAISWWAIVFSRVGLRPILEPLLLLGAAWFWWRRPWLAGIFLGLTTYSYTAARVVLIIPLLYLAYILLFRKRLRVELSDYRSAVVILIVALIVYLPLGLTLQADPTLQERVQQLSGPLSALRGGDFGPILQAIFATLGVFAFLGDPLWSYTIPGTPLFDLLTGLLFIVGLSLVIWRLGQRPIYGFVLIWLSVTLVPSAVAPDAPSLIRLIGAMPIVYLLPSLAVGVLWYRLSTMRQLLESGSMGPSRLWVPNIAIAGLIVVVLLLNLGRTLRGGFLVWPAAAEVRQKYQSVWLDISRHWRDAPAEALVVADSWYEPVKADSLRRDFGHNLPARWVQQGNAIVFPASDSATFYVPEFAPPSPELMSLAGLRQPDFRSDAFPSYAIHKIPARTVLPSNRSPTNFSRQAGIDPIMSLQGYQLLETGDESSLKLVTYWKVEAPLPQDLAIFVHILDAEDELISQQDGLDVAAPTLMPGDSFLQLHSLNLPPDDVPFSLQLGLYTRGDGQRLLHSGQPADRVILDLDSSR